MANTFANPFGPAESVASWPLTSIDLSTSYGKLGVSPREAGGVYMSGLGAPIVGLDMPIGTRQQYLPAIEIMRGFLQKKPVADPRGLRTTADPVGLSAALGNTALLELDNELNEAFAGDWLAADQDSLPNIAVSDPSIGDDFFAPSLPPVPSLEGPLLIDSFDAYFAEPAMRSGADAQRRVLGRMSPDLPATRVHMSHPGSVHFVGFGAGNDSFVSYVSAFPPSPPISEPTCSLPLPKGALSGRVVTEPEPEPEQTTPSSPRPKRPLNAFILWSCEERRNGDYSGCPANYCSSTLRDKWSKLPADEKEVWRTKSRKLFKEFKEKYPQLSYHPSKGTRKAKPTGGGAKKSTSKRASPPQGYTGADFMRSFQ